MPDEKRLTLPTGLSDLHSGDGDLNAGSIYFIGTATVIIRYGDFTILTDPNFLHKGEQVKLGYGLRSTRRTNPAIDIEHLPPLDLVVLSHMHEDHFDHVAEEKLDKSVPIITTEHAAASLKKSGFRSPIALSTWGSIAITKGDVTLRITSMPGRHGPGPLTAALPPVMGSMLEWIRLGSTEPLFKLYITGDTLMFSDLKRIPELFPNIDLVLLHLGGTRVMGLMLTMDDKQGVQMLKLVRPKMAIPVHFNDYTVFKSPLRDFVRAVKEAGLQGKVRYLKHGDIHHFQVAHTAPVGGTSRNTDAGTTDKSPNAIP